MHCHARHLKLCCRRDAVCLGIRGRGLLVVFPLVPSSRSRVVHHIGGVAFGRWAPCCEHCMPHTFPSQKLEAEPCFVLSALVHCLDSMLASKVPTCHRAPALCQISPPPAIRPALRQAQHGTAWGVLQVCLLRWLHDLHCVTEAAPPCMTIPQLKSVHRLHHGGQHSRLPEPVQVARPVLVVICHPTAPKCRRLRSLLARQHRQSPTYFPSGW